MPIITLMRHCEPLLPDGKKRYIGIMDIDLSEVGQNRAKALAPEFIGYDAIYCSNLLRTRQTADIIGACIGITPVSTPALREIDMGAWEGLSFDEVKLKYPAHFAERGLNPFYSAAPDGESYAGVCKRASAFLSEIDAAKNNLFITHLGVIRALMFSSGTINNENFWTFNFGYGKYTDYTY